MASTIRKLGTDDDHEAAGAIAGECYHQTSLLISGFVRELGGWHKLPPKFVISDGESGGWHGAEVAINQAVLRGDWITTWDLCAEYKARVIRYLDAARKMAKA